MQLSLLAIKELTEGYLQEKGVPNAKFETDLLIAHVLRMQRLDVYLNFDRPISAKERDCLRPLVKRRGQREPLQYILGYQDFCDCTLKVDPRALIPRPETEQLIERIVQSLAEPPARILDLGTWPKKMRNRCSKLHQLSGSKVIGGRISRPASNTI